MKLKILYHGPLWLGSTSLQRAEAFARLPGVEMIESDNGHRVGGRSNLIHRIRWKSRWPIDVSLENERLFERVMAQQPDIVFVDNSKVIHRSTLKEIRQFCSSRLVYYTPDDVMGKHNLSHPLRLSFPEWDVFFTTKTFNVDELRQAGVRRPLLIGKSFDPILHAPMSADAVGTDYEAFGLVFIGTYELERFRSINALAEAGFSIVLYSGEMMRWKSRKLHSAIILRPAVFAQDYRRCWHHGRLALCFLRKLNRDRITQRTMEIAAMARPMLAEKTDEHDAHFLDGKEYLGFSNDEELITLARTWLARDEDRIKLGLAARERCETSGYSTDDRAKWMVKEIMA
jgi:spore maturation protein CgeB